MVSGSISLASPGTPRVHLVVAARPNFMKIAPLYHALVDDGTFEPVLVHTGQHYDDAMSGAFLRDLRLPEPHVHLGVGSGTHAEQTGGVMIAYERLCSERRPDRVVVPGDVNSTVACAIASKKLGIGVVHLEAGLRSFDRAMPEEINRILTDSISDLLWTPSEDADTNLMREGIQPERIDRIGNIMIDSFEMMRPLIEVEAERTARDGRAVVTLHRPSNVDDPAKLAAIVDVLVRLSESIPLLFPLHPRTAGKLRAAGLMARLEAATGISLSPPLGYVSFLAHVTRAAMVITDSGGVQEETTYLGIPCLTLRANTERPITVSQGTNRLVAVEELGAAVGEAMRSPRRSGTRPDRWDGHTAQRAVASLRRFAEAA